MTSTTRLRQRIAKFDGGELTDTPVSYFVVFPLLDCRAVIYTTKLDAAWRLFAPELEELPVGMIAHYGLPRDHDIPWIAKIICDLDAYFLGDCDPYDLLIYAWLKHHLPVQFLGTSDAVVSALGVEVNERMTIPLGDEEQQALLLLTEVWPDFPKSIGLNCAQLLNSNQKLEIEALASYRTKPASDLVSLVRNSTQRTPS